MSDSPANLTTNDVAESCRDWAKVCEGIGGASRCNVLLRAAKEIDRLTAEVAELRLSADANLYVAQQHMLRESVMASEVAELRRDAERYRWLRDHWWLDDKADATPAPMMNAQSPEQFDAAIDAALGDSRDA